MPGPTNHGTVGNISSVAKKHLHEFCEGFRAGYDAIAEGGDGCTPAFPPRQYWGWRYQSAEGQEKVAAWYAGFPHGARAAEEDGIGNWGQIQTSSAIQQRYDEHGMLGPGQTPGMYPMPAAQPIAAVNAAKFKAEQEAAAAAAAGSGTAYLSDSAPGPHAAPPNAQGQILRK